LTSSFSILPDDTKLVADGADTTRVVLRVTDEFGAIRSLANDALQLDVEGPGEIIGDNPFALVGGTGAVWLRAKEQAGRVRLTASHPVLGKRQVDFEIIAASPEAV
jgi:beta-galactosidase